MKFISIKFKVLLSANTNIRFLRRHLSESKIISTMKFLNVAEKNDAAKNIANHLSRGTSRRREGLSQYNKIYEFETMVQNQKCTMVMTSVSGHLLSLEFVGAYRNWQSCNPLSLFEAPVVKMCPDNYQNIKKTLEREVRGCHGLIIWTDCDREGENIGFEIIQVCKEIKSNLKIFRAKFSEITSTSVKRALDALGEPNKNTSDAVDVRQELDLRIGAAFTRFQTLRLQKVFPSKLADSLVSYGSCQFPTLGFVVERYRAIESFIPESFWKIKVSHTIQELTVDYTWQRGRLFDEQACRVLHDVCLENSLATVTNVQSKPKAKWRPLPLDTIEMEKIVSRKLKINAKETMKIAEKLYTQGLISYPRTETNQYPSNMNISNLVELQTGSSEWGAFAQGILDSGGPTPRQGNKSDQAHPPIHPTKFTDGLSGNEKRIYEFIVRSFLACCSKDAQGQETNVQIDIAQEKFNASGLMITENNYLDVYPYDKWSAKQLHVYQIGQQFTPTKLDLVDGQTSAPNLLTEADLIALMEKHGIGTDATHAEHIETIKSRSYVALTDNVHFVPGVLGMGLVDGYDAMGLPVAKPDLRAQLESDLKDICEGRKDPRVVLAQQVAKYREVYVTVTTEALKIDQALAQRFNENPIEADTNVTSANPAMFPSVMKCPKCKCEMTLRTKKDGQGWFIGCMSYPQCTNAIWFPSIVDSVRVLDYSCNVCGPNFKMLEFKWKNRTIDHMYPSPYVDCIGGCNGPFTEIMNVSMSSVRPSSSTSNMSADSGLGSNSSRSMSTNTQTTTRNSSTAGTSNFNRPNAQYSSNRQANSHDGSYHSPTTNSTNYNERLKSTGITDSRWGGTAQGNSGQIDIQDGDNSVLCSCHKPAVLLTVKKSNHNLGRKFYKCQMSKEMGGCDFFLWAPENGGNSNITNSSSGISETTAPSAQDRPSAGYSSDNQSRDRTQSWPTQDNQGSSSWNRGPAGIDAEVPSCNCHVPAKKVTVQKEGPNKGKLFFGCPNPPSSRCTFFQWADESHLSSAVWGATSANHSGDQNDFGVSRGRGRGRGGTLRGRGARGGGVHSEGTRRKCSNCREEGHTRNKCPRLQ